MRLSDEMRRLTQLFQATHENRTDTVSSIRAGTAEQLRQQREDLALTAAEGAQQRADFKERLQQNVAGLRRDAADFLHEADTSLRLGATEAAQGRAEFVGELRLSVGTLMQGLRAARQDAAAAEAQERASYVQDKRHETAVFLKGSTSDLRAIAMGGAQSRAGFLQGVQQDVRTLRAETAGFLSEADAARQAEAAQDAEQRGEFIESLRQSVQERRQEIVAARRMLRTDLTEARQVWRSYNMLAPLRKGRKPATIGLSKQATAPTGQNKQAPAPVAAAHPVAADPLTAIRGIGQATEKILHDQGIQTYSRLAAANPDQIRAILGERGRLAKVEEWIEQARKLNGSA